MLTASGPPARLEFFGTTTVQDAGATIAASDAENPFPFNVVNKGTFNQIDNAKLTLDGAASFINDLFSRYEILNNEGIDLPAHGSTSAFINMGLVFKRAGSGASVFRVPVAMQVGEFVAGQGSIHLDQGGFVDNGIFLGNTASPNAILFAGNYTFHQYVQTDIGQMALVGNSRITLSTLYLGEGLTAGEWTQNADFDVAGRGSRVEMGAGTVLRNTGSLVTRDGGALVGRASAPLAEESNPVLDIFRARVASNNPISPGTPRGLLRNEGSFDGVILAGPLSEFDVTDVINAQDAGFRFRPVDAIDYPGATSNTVGTFENSGRVTIAPVSNVFGLLPAMVVAEAFTQQGSPALGRSPELKIEQGGELRTDTFRQTAGATFLGGLLTGRVVEFKGGRLLIDPSGDLQIGGVTPDGFIEPGGAYTQTATETVVEGRLRGDSVTIQGGSLLVRWNGLLVANSFTQTAGDTVAKGQIQVQSVKLQGGNTLVDEFGQLLGNLVEVQGGSLSIDSVGRLRALTFKQTAGDTAVRGRLTADSVTFEGVPCAAAASSGRWVVSSLSVRG